MFVTKKKMEAEINNIDKQIGFFNERYWDLWQKHELLLRHLGLVQITTPEKKELKPKEINNG